MQATIGARFVTTPWTLIECLRDTCGDRHAAAMGLLSATYWPCIFVYLRKLGYNPEQAADLTQGFFSDVLLQRQLFAKADRRRGRLRTLLRAALSRFCVDMHRRQSVTGRRFVLAIEDVLERESLVYGSRNETPEQAFDRHWASGVLSETLRRCESHYAGTGRAHHWVAYEALIVKPCQYGCEPPALDALAAKLGFAHPNAVSSAVHVVKTRVRIVLRQVIRETAPDRDEACDEVAYIESLLETAAT